MHAVWCSRISLAEPAPWRRVLASYDELLGVRDDAIVRLNRAVALAEVAGPGAALAWVSTEAERRWLRRRLDSLPAREAPPG